MWVQPKVCDIDMPLMFERGCCDRRKKTTVRERTMMALMNELTDMPDWERKIFDTQFTFTWKSAKVMTGKDVTRSMADWVSLSSYPGAFAVFNTV